MDDLEKIYYLEGNNIQEADGTAGDSIGIANCRKNKKQRKILILSSICEIHVDLRIFLTD